MFADGHLEAELSSIVLHCAAWGTPASDLPFLDCPPAGALAADAALLKDLGALNNQNRITLPASKSAAIRVRRR